MKPNRAPLLVALLLLPIFAGSVSLLHGAYSLELKDILKILLSTLLPVERTWSSSDETVLLYVRLPRILLCALVGSTLSVAGAVLQAVFRNPLVSPYLLGISSGASFGASIVIVLLNSFNPLLIHSSAFVFGGLAVTGAYLISKMYGQRDNTILVLSGVIITSFFSALVALLQYFTEQDKLQAIVFWMMGSFSSSQWRHIVQVIPFVLVGCLLLPFLSWRINVISLGDQEAQSLGVNPERFRLLLILITTLMTTSVVSVAGPIGWVGLIIPHIVRILVGANNRDILLGSIGLGSTYLIIVDFLSRNLYGFEIPVGIITALVGCPFFIYLIHRGRQTVW